VRLNQQQRLARWLAVLIAAVLVVVALTSPSVHAKAGSPWKAPDGWVTLNGQRLIEIKVAAGAPNPVGLAGRLSAALQTFANDNTRLHLVALQP
jgi:hypothetical protein